MKRRRCGYSLIEALVVIALTGITLTIVALCMHTLYRAERELRSDFQNQRTIAKVASQLRADAHQATSVATMKGTDNPLTRILTLSLQRGQTIEYALGTKGLDRTVRRGETTDHHEHFQLAGTSKNFWIVDGAREHPFIALHLINHQTSDDSTAQHDVTVIQAAVGLTGRIAPKP